MQEPQEEDPAERLLRQRMIKMSCKYSPCKYSLLGFSMLYCDKMNCHSNICNASKSEYKICVRYQELEDGINLMPEQFEDLQWLNENGYSASLTPNQAEMLKNVKCRKV